MVSRPGPSVGFNLHRCGHRVPRLTQVLTPASSPASGIARPGLGTASTGVVLLIFEIIELFLMPFHPVMHPLLIAWSLAIIWLPFTRSARQHLEV